ncbi:MAG: hypothetical protein CM15mV131_430 [uncultured marine virus]|nr:MAG: hypothetical protein CM15mV131_430 [uncultured marine virus]
MSSRRRDTTLQKTRGWNHGDSGRRFTYSKGFMPSEMITHAYLLNKDKKNVRTFASYEANDEYFQIGKVFQEDV